MSSKKGNKDKRAKRKMGNGATDGDGDSSDWSNCPHCGVRLKTRNLPRHVKRMHDTIIEPDYRPKRIGGKGIAIMTMLITLVLVISAYIIIYAPWKEDNPNGQPPDDGKPDELGDPPHHSLGSGGDDWWSTYPDQHTNPGTDVNHTQYVLDELSYKPVVILVHSDCPGCREQYEDMLDVLEEYGEKVAYIDLPADWSDNRTYECYNVYDSTPGGYIPLTVVVTHIKEGNDIKVGWHSAEGSTGKDWIRAYFEDSIYYYDLAH